MQRALYVHLANVPIDASVRAAWVLPGGYKKAADPERLGPGGHDVFLNWRTRARLMDRILAIDLWTPTPPALPPIVGLEGASLTPMAVQRNLRRFSFQVELAVRG